MNEVGLPDSSETEAAGTPMRFAYADPPYLGCGRKLYGHLHPDAADYDDPEAHRDLIQRLCDEYPDGWALSLHEPSLRQILTMCPDDVRVGAWCKTYHQIFVNVAVQHAWEPIIWRGGRPLYRRSPLVRDWTTAVRGSHTHGQATPGEKPEAFSWWLFDVLGCQPGDTLDDLFPGSGAVGRAWDRWLANRPLWEAS